MLDSLHICGFGWQGIGINDMHKEAWKVAKRILSGVQDGGGAEIKGGVFLMPLSFAKNRRRYSNPRNSVAIAGMAHLHIEELKCRFSVENSLYFCRV